MIKERTGLSALTDGARDVPILHGLGFLRDVVGEKVRDHGNLVTADAAELRTCSSKTVVIVKSIGSVR